MVSALGYSDNAFDVTNPGRLCRGRERWIEPWELDDAPGELRRIVISGAAFSDDSASDARRGIIYSGLELATLITSLYPRRTLLVFMEDGHPADIPADAIGIEAYEGYRAGGRSELGLVRWHKRISGINAVREVLGDDASPDGRVRGFAIVEADTDDDQLIDRLFPLVGYSTLDSPPARYQPAALPEILDVVKAVILLHRDKHGPALGIYTRDEVPKLTEKLAKLCETKGTLLVPFAIPPMLARWDRAIAELREEWMEQGATDFPVPPAPEPSAHERRRGRRGRRDEAHGQGNATEE